MKNNIFALRVMQMEKFAKLSLTDLFGRVTADTSDP